VTMPSEIGSGRRRPMRWADHIPLNIYWLGLNVTSGVITPVLLPYLVAIYAPAQSKNTYLAMIRVVSLGVAMAIQPIAGMLSDRSTSRWGRRRPFIVAGTALDLLFLALIASSPLLLGSSLDRFFRDAFGVSAAYAALLAGVVLLQFSSNLAHGAVQGLIPDLVPPGQRGRSSGVKAVMEMLPVFFVILVGPLVDAGRVWLTVGIIMATLIIAAAVTVAFVREKPLRCAPAGPLGGRILRLISLAAIFVLVTQGVVWAVKASGRLLVRSGAGSAMQIAVVGLAGLLGMAGAVFVGVYVGATVGIGRQARDRRPFIWWVINRLLFLAALSSVQGFAQYFISDVLRIPRPATFTALLLGVVGLFLLPSALGGGWLADRIGRIPLVAGAGLVSGGGTLLLLFAGGIPLTLVGASLIGLGAGTFMATNWALGTDLVPADEAGRYLGISNLAGAGAGIVGAGIGGPLADFFNAVKPGLGYLVIFGLYGALFLLSSLALTQVRPQTSHVGGPTSEAGNLPPSQRDRSSA
jgi:MFS family permease